MRKSFRNLHLVKRNAVKESYLNKKVRDHKEPLDETSVGRSNRFRNNFF